MDESLLFNHQDITFDYAISLDGICFYWWVDHAASISQLLRSQGFIRPFPLERKPLRQLLRYSGIVVPSRFNDVMPNNVRINLEVQARCFYTP